MDFLSIYSIARVSLNTFVYFQDSEFTLQEVPRHQFREAVLWLLLGIVMLCFAVGSQRSGRTWTKIGGWVYRSENPRWYRFELSVGYLVSIGTICYSLLLLTRVFNS